VSDDDTRAAAATGDGVSDIDAVLVTGVADSVDDIDTVLVKGVTDTSVADSVDNSDTVLVTGVAGELSAHTVTSFIVDTRHTRQSEPVTVNICVRQQITCHCCHTAPLSDLFPLQFTPVISEKMQLHNSPPALPPALPAAEKTDWKIR